MSAFRTLWVWSLVVCGACPAVRADVLTLTDGRVVRGTLERTVRPAQTGEDSTVEFLTLRGVRMRVPGERVWSVERWAECLDTYREWCDMAHTADDWTICGDWCASKGNPDEAGICWNRAIELEPDHATAHARLGHRKVDGRWVLVDEPPVVHSRKRAAAPPAPAPPQERSGRRAGRASGGVTEVGSWGGKRREPRR